jgi:hypothetical protein
LLWASVINGIKRTASKIRPAFEKKVFIVGVLLN